MFDRDWKWTEGNLTCTVKDMQCSTEMKLNKRKKGTGKSDNYIKCNLIILMIPLGTRNYLKRDVALR